MINQFTVVMPEPEIEHLRSLAARQQQELGEFVAEKLRAVVGEVNGRTNGQHLAEEMVEDWTTPDAAIERKEAAYIALHPTLKKKYYGKHVAIFGGKLIDVDNDGQELYRRINAQYPDDFVWMTEVKDEPIDVVYTRSPRFAPRR